MRVKTIIKIAAFAFVVFVCSLTPFGQERNKCAPPNVFDYDDDHTLTVEVGSLLKEPKCYDGMFVRTIGFYLQGFEVSKLFCLDCQDTGGAWVNTENYYAAMKRCTSAENLKKLRAKDEATFGVVVLGVLKTRLGFNNPTPPKDIGSKRMSELVTGGGYGHMNAYDSEFSPICFEQVEVFSNDYLTHSAEGEKTLKRMKQWYEKAYEKL
jgi:hypothetical protein